MYNKLNPAMNFQAFTKVIFKKSQKNNRLYILAGINLIIASLLLAWFYRQPIINTYLKESPRSYKLEKFNPKIRYVLTKADTIKGKNNPKDRIKVILTKPKIKITTSADKIGNWKITLPEKLYEKRYKMSVISFDKNGKNPKIKSYRIRVESDNKLANSKIYQNFKSFYKKNLQKFFGPLV